MSGEETVQERLMTVLKVSGCEFDDIKISELLDCWGLKHRSSDRISQLSGGLARRLSVLSGLAPALLSKNPRVVLLDEPPSEEHGR
jgi:ABC-type multidrug transport system ATPase subunit